MEPKSHNDDDDYIESIYLDESNIKKKRNVKDSENDTSSDVEEDDRDNDPDWNEEEMGTDDAYAGSLYSDYDDLSEPCDDLMGDDDPASYIHEINSLLNTHGDVSCENALTLNKEMQKSLLKIRNRIQEMLGKIKNQFSINEKELKTFSSYSYKPRSMRCDVTSIGSQYFKDLNGRRCPFNNDYSVRSSQGEWFPTDLSIRPFHHWTLIDKMGIIQGIKEQILDYLDQKNDKKNKTLLQKNVELHSLKLKQLLSEVDDKFQIDWHQISVNSLKDRHTASSCHGMWIQYLHPDIDRKKWSKEEEMKLYNIAKKYNFQNWSEIAAEHKNRSEYQCFIQYQTSIKSLMQSRFKKWTKEEDQHLLQVINKCKMNGVIPWNRVASHFPERTKQQCHCRYIYSINPQINHGTFTPEEDCILLAAVEEYGEKFHCLPKALFPNRTVVQLRNRYLNCLKKRKECTFWTADDDQRLLDLVERLGISNWKKISDQIGNHTRTSCRTRYCTIKRYLKEHPNTALDKIPRKKRLTNTDINKDNWIEKIVELQKIKATEQNEIQSSKTKRTKLKTKQKYCESLRPLDLKFYNFLKYSYDFRLGAEFNRIMKSTRSLEYTQLICNFKLPPVLQIEETLPAASIEACVKFYEEMNTRKKYTNQVVDVKPGRLLPPNWSTMMGFRALCIESGGTEQQYYAMMHETNTSAAIQTFRSRLKTLFLRTAILSRLNPETVYNIITVQLKSNEDILKSASCNTIDVTKRKNTK